MLSAVNAYTELAAAVVFYFAITVLALMAVAAVMAVVSLLLLGLVQLGAVLLERLLPPESS